jgi:hypothetical protein
VIERPPASETQSNAPAPAKAGAGHFKRLRSPRNILFGGVFLSTGAFVVQACGSGLEVAVAQAHGAPGASLAYRDGPPAGFSGGFGEDHCQACHSGDKVNARPGRLTISAPERYSPGKTYTVTITLRRPGMAMGGFQFTARFEADSAQAGTLTVVDGQQDRVKVLTDRGVQYAYHSRPGTQLTATDVVRWTLHWTAPAGSRAVLFHAAANAANGDDSQSGDFVYTSRVRSRGR